MEKKWQMTLAGCNFSVTTPVIIKNLMEFCNSLLQLKLIQAN